MHSRDGSRGSHFHVGDFTKPLSQLLGFSVPELTRLGQEHGMSCIEGDADRFFTGLFKTARAAQMSVTTRQWPEPKRRSLSNENGLTQAILDVGTFIAGENPDEELRGVGVAYTLYTFTCILNGQPEEKLISFQLYRIAALSRRLLDQARAAETQEAFAPILERAKSLQEEVQTAYESGQMPSPGLWGWFPASRAQVQRIWAKEGGLSDNLLGRVLTRLGKLGIEDGEMLRNDDVLDRIITEEQSKVAAREAFGEALRRNMETTLREFGLPTEIPVALTVSGDDVDLPDLAKAVRCQITIGFKPGQFGLMVETAAEHPLEKLFKGLGRSVEVIELDLAGVH